MEMIMVQIFILLKFLIIISIRYVSLICFKELDHGNIYSYEFFGDQPCLSLNTEKILLGKK